MRARDSDERLLLSRHLQLPPDVSSGSAARRVLRQVLAEADREDWIDAAELALGEVVANAVLHAHTAIEVTLQVRFGAVHVEVRDSNPIMPIPRDYEVEATTGRGMAMVAALTRVCGVRSLGQAGKVVWFDVGSDDDASESTSTLLDAWDSWDELELADAAGASADDVVEIVLVGLPPLLWLAARQHHDALTRELMLHAAEHPVIGIDGVAADRARGTISEALALRLEELRRTRQPDASSSYDYRGSQPWMPAAIDLVVGVSRSLGSAFPALQETLDTAERLATDGRLLTPPGLPEIVEVRDWVCSQVVAQLAGAPPSPWPGSAQSRFETMSRRRVDEPAWDPSVVTDSHRGVAAADDANRLLAVSGPLAAALGWEVDDLVGRRVVTLVPPSLREAHVAAFTRHLATGNVHVLGQDLQLPVLRKDGSEVLCRFRVERAAHTGGLTIFLAWIEPVDPGHTLSNPAAVVGEI